MTDLEELGRRFDASPTAGSLEEFRATIGRRV
jgi:hypothetical protein